MKFFTKKFASLFICLGVSLAALLQTGCGTNNAQTWKQHGTNENSVYEVARFHVGDTVIISVTGLPEAIPDHEEPIKEDGTISMPDIGKVQAAGKTAGELQDAIYHLYVPAIYTHVNITVKVGDRVYYVTGEVKAPGRQVYLGETTVTRAITSAGDFTDFADRRKVYLTRASGQRIKVNCVKALENPQLDPPVYPGDQIQVLKSWAF